MKKVFVDTAGWVALKDTSDSLHSNAHVLNKELLAQGVNYITSNFVLDESYTLLLSRTFHTVAIQFGEEIRASHIVAVVHVSEELEDEAWRLFSRYSDKAFSFTDCTSFVIMQQRGVVEAFTNDHHFEQMGYRKLLK